METDVLGSRLYANLINGQRGFQVRMRVEAKSFEHGWIFDEAGCREAAKFFIELADELKRRAE